MHSYFLVCGSCYSLTAVCDVCIYVSTRHLEMFVMVILCGTPTVGLGRKGDLESLRMPAHACAPGGAGHETLLDFLVSQAECGAVANSPKPCKRWLDVMGGHT